MKEIEKAIKQNKQINFNKFLYFIPAIFDIGAICLNFFGLIFVTASIFQMMRLFMIIITALLSWLILGKKYYRHHIFGIILIISGLIIVGISSICHSQNQGKLDSVQPIGFVFLLIAEACSGFLYVIEELLFKKCYCDPFLAEGLEGLSEISILLIVIPILNLIPTPTLYNNNGNIIFAPFGVVESIPYTFAQILLSNELLILVISSILSMTLFALCGISITYFISSTSRAVIDPPRALITWFFSILFGWEDFIFGELIGFIIASIGALIFNEVIRISIFGLNEYTQEKLNQNKLKLNS